ncbi:MAG: anti-sigma factor antagonist [Pseudonocardiales bacterium]|nr:anti-sigma factor antagonist [Pseudonocardiales bacterium]
MEFSVAQQTVEGVPVVTVRGEIDVYSAPALKDALIELLAPEIPAVVVDLTEVGFLDSTGLGALVAARTSATDSDARLPIVSDRDRILKLFRITGLDAIFEIYPSVEAAVTAVNSPAPEN